MILGHRHVINKSKRKWKSSMSFGDTTYMNVIILSPPHLLILHFFGNFPTYNAKELHYTYIHALMDLNDSIIKC